jgi:protein TonB
MVKIKYRLSINRRLDYAFIFSLLLLIILFYSFKKFDGHTTLRPVNVPYILIEEIPQVKLPQRPSPPEKPRIPIESDDDELSQDVTIEPTDFYHFTIASNDPEPPLSDLDPIVPFAALSEKPKLTFKAAPAYPQLALKAGIQGTVIVTVTIDKKGLVENALIEKSVPMLDDAALDAARKCKFKPAKQRDKFVRVRLSIPFKFKLR